MRGLLLMKRAPNKPTEPNDDHRQANKEAYAVRH